jgi:sugar phosphate isomerase/epimerase
MPRFYVNLNLRAADRDPKLLARHLDGGLPPELGLDPVLMDAVSPAWHEAMARRLDDAGLRRTLHLPFFDLQPGSADIRIRTASRDRLLLAMETATVYKPDRMIGHGAYNRFLYVHSFADWAARSADTWAEVLAAWPEHPPLCLENTYETDPATVRGLIDALRRRLPEHRAGRIGSCFDIGHWYSFAEGKSRDNLADWLDALGPCLAHLHLHDNDGSFDQHRGPGQGEIPFDALLAYLADNGLRPTVTFEPHTEAAFEAVLAFARSTPFFQR